MGRWIILIFVFVVGMGVLFPVFYYSFGEDLPDFLLVSGALLISAPLSLGAALIVRKIFFSTPAPLHHYFRSSVGILFVGFGCWLLAENVIFQKKLYPLWVFESALRDQPVSCRGRVDFGQGDQSSANFIVVLDEVSGSPKTVIVPDEIKGEVFKTNPLILKNDNQAVFVDLVARPVGPSDYYVCESVNSVEVRDDAAVIGR